MASHSAFTRVFDALMAQQIDGTWKLVSVMYEDQATKALAPIMGGNSRDYQIATKDGRWLALATPAAARPRRPMPNVRRRCAFH